VKAAGRHPPAVGRLPAPASVIWQEVEYGSYAADLPLWEELAAEAGAPILELGCGIGRVALRLARRREVWGLDMDRHRLRELERRAREASLPVRTVEGDARAFSLQQSFGLIFAPMQLAELLGASGCGAMLHAAAGHLAPGGKVAITVLDREALPARGEEDERSPLPDVRERDGWVFSSLPLGLERVSGTLRADRLRQAVSPGGELAEELEAVTLELLRPSDVEGMAADAGLHPVGRRTVPATKHHAGSVVVLAEAADD
jgi:SAM-dependent methyltransferase